MGVGREGVRRRGFSRTDQAGGAGLDQGQMLGGGGAAFAEQPEPRPRASGKLCGLGSRT